MYQCICVCMGRGRDMSVWWEDGEVSLGLERILGLGCMRSWVSGVIFLTKTGRGLSSSGSCLRSQELLFVLECWINHWRVMSAEKKQNKTRQEVSRRCDLLFFLSFHFISTLLVLSTILHLNMFVTDVVFLLAGNRVAADLSVLNRWQVPNKRNNDKF